MGITSAFIVFTVNWNLTYELNLERALSVPSEINQVWSIVFKMWARLMSLIILIVSA
jgi:hypothetical protein